MAPTEATAGRIWRRRAIGRTNRGRRQSLDLHLFIDRTRLDLMSSSRRNRADQPARDALAQAAREIADASGGAFFRVAQGGGDVAFDKILQEMAATMLGAAGSARPRRSIASESEGHPRPRVVLLPKPNTALAASSPHARPRVARARATPRRSFAPIASRRAAASSGATTTALTQSLSRVPDLAAATTIVRWTAVAEPARRVQTRSRQLAPGAGQRQRLCA
jgi:hypothetical protein